MSNPASWIPAAPLEALGWALIHFLWQGTALAALAAAILLLCRRASVRYLIGLAFLILMLAAPVITFFILLNGGLAPGVPALGVLLQQAAPLLPRALPQLVDAWFLGVALLSLRFAGGFLTLEWRLHSQTSAASSHFLALCREVEQRLGLKRSIRYLECNWLEAPAGIGALRPVILFPLGVLTGLDEEQLLALIAHELAHVRRWDFAVNLFQVMSETLLFYHPAIWWLNRCIRAEREICCDEIAVAACGNPLAYARALARLAEWKHVPGLAMAASHGLLADRILKLLGRDTARPLFAAMAASLLLLLVSLTGGGLLLGKLPVHHAVVGSVQAEMVPAPPSVVSSALEVPAPLTRRRPALKRMVRIALPRTPFPILPSEEKVATAETPMPAETSLISVSDTPSAPPPMEPAMSPPSGARGKTYPAATLPILAPHNIYEWEQAQLVDYCDRYAEQTLMQGANQPLALDDAAKGRYAFFHWHCMLRNGDTALLTSDRGPDYVPLGAVSAGPAASAAGTWAISFGPFPASNSCTFIQQDHALTGSCARSAGGGSAQGVVDGKQVRWSWTYLDDQKLPVELDFVGIIGPDGVLAGQSIQIRPAGPRLIRSFSAHPGAPIVQLASRD